MMLYHYTSLEGLLGIVSSQSLWGTHTSFLNDSSEFFHGLAFASSIANHLYENLDHMQTYGWSVRTAIENLKPEDLYVCSFSEVPDLLSQWRGYCPQGAGICIGFDAEIIQSFCTQNKFRLEKCLYSHDEQEALINQLIDSAYSKYPKFPLALNNYEKLNPRQKANFEIDYHISITEGENKDQADKTINDLCSELVQIVPLFKNKGFYEESEWRIIAKKPKNKILYRSKKTYLTPYIEFNFLNHTNVSALKEIIIGPGPNQERCKESIEFLLTHSEMNDVNIINSKLPYNHW